MVIEEAQITMSRPLKEQETLFDFDPYTQYPQGSS